MRHKRACSGTHDPLLRDKAVVVVQGAAAEKLPLPLSPATLVTIMTGARAKQAPWLKRFKEYHLAVPGEHVMYTVR